MNTATTCICVLGLSGVAFADVMVDQIGLDDGASIGTNIIASQNFEEAYDLYDVAALDNFTADGESISMIEMVMSGWNGFSDPSSVTGYAANLYSDPSVAGVDLVGDIDSNYIDTADTSISGSWGGEGFLVEMMTQMVAKSGTNWVSVIPDNLFASNGQTGVYASLLGDGVLGWQANPGGGFGIPNNYGELVDEIAYRLHTGALPDPCDDQLPAICPEDVTNDGQISVNDLLAIIGNWGVCGDGTYRPEGDIAPLPNGDCCVDVTDILAVVGAWGADCNVYGGCCLADGSCAEETSGDCAAAGGVYFGDNSTCADGDCSTAACCLSDMSCADMTADGCTAVGGTLHGNDTCATWDCSVSTPGDECADAVVAVDGANPFSTLDMTPSQPQPDDSMCSTSALAWDNSQDFWFEWTAGTSDTYNVRTCELGTYDTSMVIYEGSCTNQIACNGDYGTGDGNGGECQAWYSQIDLDTTAGTTYYIRLGGWQAAAGDGVLHINPQLPPVPGACCVAGGACLDNLDSDSCDAFGGVFAGEGTVCADDPCSASGAFADECADAGEASLGANAFDTSLMTASQPQPDDTQCAGTYLDWANSPDGWFSFVAGSTATHTFSTCDAASYDTSLVLYEGNCDTQVACNGDGTGGTGCQVYYSQLDYACTAGTTYYVRLGGYMAAIGSGTLTISVDDPNETAACCDMGACLGDMTAADCGTAGGTWMQGESCATYACPQPACPGGQVSQDVHGVNDGWSAGTSTIDGATDYMRADLVNVASMGDFSVWGLKLFYNGGWGACAAGADYGFNVRTYDDAGGSPGAMSSEALDVAAVEYATGDLYAGIYEGFRFDMTHSASNVGWLGVQSASDGVGCWFLWMSSGVGDGFSALSESGGAWDVSYAFDLALCID